MFRHASPSLKRHAGDPPPCFDHPGKRQKPNLHQGLSGLSLSGATTRPLYTDESSDTASEISQHHDVEVEEFDSPSSASSSESADSDVTFKHAKPRHKRHIVHADTVEMPLDCNVDLTWNVPNRKRKMEDEELEARKRRETDVDMEDAEDRVRRPKQKMQWHEPEKDRIVITSLGSPSSSRSSSRSNSPVSESHLSQPGVHGFTLNPSLLTHLLNSQRNELHAVPTPMRTEQGMVLYRPVHFPIVQEWPSMEDSSRFEEIDEDENLGEASEYAEPMDIEG